MVARDFSKLYSTIYSQTSEEESGLLVLGNSEGDLILYNLDDLVTQKKNANKEFNKLKQTITTDFGPIYSLDKTAYFCLSGSNGVISGWRWANIKDEDVKPAFTISINDDTEELKKPEVNGLAVDNEKDLVYAACGDKYTHCYDLESGKQTTKFHGHDCYVHDIALGDNLIVTCGNDGTVCSWDPRASDEPQLKLIPHEDEQLSRPKYGKFISSVDIENESLVCGGGPQAGIFELRTLSFSSVFPTNNGPIHLTKFTRQSDGEFIVAGSMPNVHIGNIAGESVSKLPSSAQCVYTAQVSNKPMLLTYGGMSTKLDVCTSLAHRDYTLSTF